MELPTKILSGLRHSKRSRSLSVWQRFDRLQRSLRPLRKQNATRKGLHSGLSEQVRDPDSADLLRVCTNLNAIDAAYIVIGGMAMVAHGLNRGTGNIDLMVDCSTENLCKLRDALSILPDNAVADLVDSNTEICQIVGIADDVVVNLIGRTCDIDFQKAAEDIEWREVNGVRIPFASPALLLLTKQTSREIDQIDRLFLEALIKRS